MSGRRARPPTDRDVPARPGRARAVLGRGRRPAAGGRCRVTGACRPLAGGTAGPRRLRVGGSRPVRGGSPVGGSRSAPRGRSLVA
ncbi:hypothetical protein BC342_06075 [Streptomyces olivaceus]|nr:hypothetical protein BC342_06075 [Streptomyces olivaceus]